MRRTEIMDVLRPFVLGCGGAEIVWDSPQLLDAMDEYRGRLAINGRVAFLLHAEQLRCAPLIREALRLAAAKDGNPRFHHASVEFCEADLVININGLPDRLLRPVLVHRPPADQRASTMTQLLDSGLAYLISGPEQSQCTWVPWHSLPEWREGSPPLQSRVYSSVHEVLQYSGRSSDVSFGSNLGPSRIQYTLKNFSASAGPFVLKPTDKCQAHCGVVHLSPGPNCKNPYLLRTHLDARHNIWGFAATITFAAHEGKNHEDALVCEEQWLKRLAYGRTRLVCIELSKEEQKNKLLGPQKLVPKYAKASATARLKPSGIHSGDVHPGDVLCAGYPKRGGTEPKIHRAERRGVVLSDWCDSSQKYSSMLYEPMEPGMGIKLFMDCQKMTASVARERPLTFGVPISVVSHESSPISRLSMGNFLSGFTWHMAASWGINTTFRGFQGSVQSVLQKDRELQPEVVHGHLRSCPGRSNMKQPFFTESGAFLGARLVMSVRLGVLPGHHPRDHLTGRAAVEQDPFCTKGGFEPLAADHCSMLGYTREGLTAPEHVASGLADFVREICSACGRCGACDCPEGVATRVKRLVGSVLPSVAEVLACHGGSMTFPEEESGCAGGQRHYVARDWPAGKRRVCGVPTSREDVQKAAEEEMARLQEYCPLEVEVALRGWRFRGTGLLALLRALGAEGCPPTGHDGLIQARTEDLADKLHRIITSLQSITKWINKELRGPYVRRNETLYLELPTSMSVSATLLAIDFAREAFPVRVFRSDLQIPSDYECNDSRRFRTLTAPTNPSVYEVDNYVDWCWTPSNVQEALSKMPLLDSVPLGPMKLQLAAQPKGKHPSPFVSSKTFLGFSGKDCLEVDGKKVCARDVTLIVNPQYRCMFTDRGVSKFCAVEVNGVVTRETPRKAGRSALPVAQLRTCFEVEIKMEEHDADKVLTPELCPYGVFAPWTERRQQPAASRISDIEDLARKWCDGCQGCVDAAGDLVPGGIAVREVANRRMLALSTGERYVEHPSRPEELDVLLEAIRLLTFELDLAHEKLVG